MGLIPAQDKTNEATVTEAKETLASREQVDASLRLRLEGANSSVVALTAESGDASAAVYIAEAEQADDDRLAD